MEDDKESKTFQNNDDEKYFNQLEKEFKSGKSVTESPRLIVFLNF